MNYLYLVEFDIGKPYKVYYNSEEELKEGLKDFYLKANQDTKDNTDDKNKNNTKKGVCYY